MLKVVVLAKAEPTRTTIKSVAIAISRERGFFSLFIRLPFLLTVDISFGKSVQQINNNIVSFYY
jgi:hypothetical protein